jgi:hypothetical protein
MFAALVILSLSQVEPGLTWMPDYINWSELRWIEQQDAPAAFVSLRVASEAIHAAPLVVTTPGGDTEQAAASHAAGQVLPAQSPGLLAHNQSGHRVIQNTPAAQHSLAAFVAAAPAANCPGGVCYAPPRLQPAGGRYRQPANGPQHYRVYRYRKPRQEQQATVQGFRPAQRVATFAKRVFGR